MQQFNILVRSGDFCRKFTTKTFSVRNLITQLIRYNPFAQVVCVWYGTNEPLIIKGVFSNDEWIKIPEDMYFVNHLPSIPEDKEGLLNQYDYRTAVNMSYVIDGNRGEYPKLHPFKGVRLSGQLPEELKQYEDAHYPLFVSDKDNPYVNKEDILLHLDGYRVEKMVNGYDVEGYIIENNRYSTNQNAE